MVYGMGEHSTGRRTSSAVVILVFVVLVLAAVGSLGPGFATRNAGRAVGAARPASGRQVVAPGRPTVGAAVNVDSIEPQTSSASAAAPPAADRSAADSSAADSFAPALDVPAGVAPMRSSLLPTGGAVLRQRTGNPPLSSLSDPHRLADPAAHRGESAVLPPDSTPLAAAAGSEPASMAPLTGIPPGWVTSVHRFSQGSILRSYLLVRPKARSLTPLSVVVVLHGRSLTPADIERISQMPATTGPAIQVYPAGYGRSWNAGGCCGVAHGARVDDVAFLLATVRHVLATQHDASASRVYLVGYSNGGRMAYRMVCNAPGMWAGMAAIEAVPVDTCTSTSPVPVIVVASNHDPLLTIRDGRPRKVMQGYVQPTVQTTIEQWRHLDGCTVSFSESVTGRATVDTWDRCRGNGRVAYALYQNGSHAWPSGTEGASGTPSAEDLVWAWLLKGAVISAAAA